jgi:hypothetical protein
VHVDDLGAAVFPKGRTTTRPTAVNRPLNRPIPPRGALTVSVDKGPAVTLVPLTRPPLAGPYAFSRIPTPVDNNPKIYLLRNPPPTWIFSAIDTGYTKNLQKQQVFIFSLSSPKQQQSAWRELCPINH